MIAALAFYAFAAVLIGSAVMVVTSRNPVHSVLFLILAFFNAAGLFLLAGAEFLAMILVIVYVGAVAEVNDKNGKADGSFGRRYGQDEHGEDLARQIIQMRGKRHQVQIDR